MTILRFLMAAGALSIAVAAPGAPPEAQDGGDTVETRYGRRLVGETYAIIGPLVADPAMRYAGNNLACTNCHLDDGTRQGALPLVTSYADYPQYTARAGRQETIEDRVNGCMTEHERSRIARRRGGNDRDRRLPAVSRGRSGRAGACGQDLRAASRPRLGGRSRSRRAPLPLGVRRVPRH